VHTIIAVEPYHVCMFDISPIDAAHSRIRATVLEDIEMLESGLAEDSHRSLDDALAGTAPAAADPDLAVPATDAQQGAEACAINRARESRRPREGLARLRQEDHRH
jgi:hypothetical protein